MNKNYEDGFGADVGQSAVAARNVKAAPNTLIQVANTITDAEQLSRRVKEVVGRLCGYIPEPCEGSGDAGCEGVLPELASMSERARLHIREAHGELDRLLSHFE